MTTAGEETAGLDTVMSHEEQAPVGKADDAKPTYKSFKFVKIILRFTDLELDVKKFRKLKIKFDDAMRQSNENYLLEQRGIQLAKRLAIENDQILEMLLDQNNSAQMPVDKRIDLSSNDTNLPPIPSLVSDDELASFANLQGPEAASLYKEIQFMIQEKARLRVAATPHKSLAMLLATIPHIDLDSPHAPKEILDAFKEGEPLPPTYLTPDQIDEYIEAIDVKLGLEPRSEHEGQEDKSTSQDVSFGNTHSPYNWLRKHVPHIFLQDGEGSEKSHGKPGALRGAGKRASIPAPSKPDALEIVEEDGIGYEFALGGPVAAKGKRKREEDDGSGGYHPKSGSKIDEVKTKKPRVSKKKNPSDEATASTTGSARKRKPKAKAPTPDPNAHPFGSL